MRALEQIGVGKAEPPRPPNRTCGFPAYGSPVSGFLIGSASRFAPRALFVDDLEPELGAFGLLDPQPQNFLLAVGIECERHVDGLGERRLVGETSLGAHRAVADRRERTFDNVRCS